MSKSKIVRFRPVVQNDGAAVNRAIGELKNDRRFQKFVEAIYALREEAFHKATSDDVIANERVSLAYMSEARAYQELLTRIESVEVIPQFVQQEEEPT